MLEMPRRSIDSTVYLRFVVDKIDEDSERELGVFHAIANLQAAGQLHPHEVKLYESVRKWFSENLEKPTHFTASKPPYYRKKSKALSWFKDSAHEHLSRIREVVVILDQHGVRVQMLKAKRAGYIVYEDEFQIVAEPFADSIP
jgi:hypothetical protein